MPVIDADTHVDETEETWEFLKGEDRAFTPATIINNPPSVEGETPRGYNRYWVIDGQLRLRRNRDDKRTGTVQETRELTDIGARLRHMDELGVDIQVMYPTLFLMQVSGHAEIELALCKSYNRWMASKWAQAGGRLRWVAPLPLLSMDAALDELRFAVEHGACGVLKKGRECGNRMASDPYFMPLYREASRLNVPICFHLGSGDPELTDAIPSAVFGMLNLTLPVLDAFHALAMSDIPQTLPDLRVGFIETTASWIPYIFTELARFEGRMSWLKPFELTQDLLRDNRFYVSCDTYDDLPQIIDIAGDDNFIIGTDYSHADMSAEIEAIQILREKGEQGHIDQSTVKKILDNNARAFYGL